MDATDAAAETRYEHEETVAPDPAFRYTRPAFEHHARAAVEELVVLAVGYGQYRSNKAANEPDFDLGYDWTSLRAKLVFDAVSFDNNRFPTNWLTHPLAGYFYYSAARGNRLGIAASLGFALASSAVWEYLGEFQEQVAINDLLVTPMTGAALGEPALQLGAFFHRARPSGVTRALGWLFAPIKSAHDALDGLEPSPADEVDELGLPLDVWHHLELGGAAGFTKQQGGLTQGDVRLAAESLLVNLPRYGRGGRRTTAFDSGEVSGLRFAATTAAGELVDFVAEGHTVAAGAHTQDVQASDGGLEGTSWLGGLRLGAEYGVHDYDRDRRRSGDRVGIVSAGVTGEGRLYAGRLTVRLGLDATATFAGVDAYALPTYERIATGDPHAGMPSVLRNQGYYHAYGATLKPSIGLSVARFDAGSDVRVDWFEAITELDRDPDHGIGNVLTPRDQRLAARAWLGVRVFPHVRLSVTGERRERSGEVGSVHATRAEVGLYGGASVVF